MHYRTLFFSDIHLGMKGSQSRAFLEFFKHHEFDTIYIVGDFIDFWALKKGKWDQDCNDVLQKLLRRHRKGTAITWIVGNHDEFMAQFVGISFGGIEVKLFDIHTTADGKRYRIMHGHELDPVMRYAKWLMYLGTWAYDVLLWINVHFNRARIFFGLKYWSLSSYLKHKIKNAVNFIGSFEKGMTEFAHEDHCVGVIAGHIHSPADRMIEDIHYINCGDWVESMTAVVEHMDGRIELLKI